MTYKNKELGKKINSLTVKIRREKERGREVSELQAELDNLKKQNYLERKKSDKDEKKEKLEFQTRMKIYRKLRNKWLGKSQKIMGERSPGEVIASFFSNLFISVTTGMCSAAILGLVLGGMVKSDEIIEKQAKDVKERVIDRFEWGEWTFPDDNKRQADWLDQAAFPEREKRKIRVLLRAREHALFYGPPGSGKTHLAHELARNESVAYAFVKLNDEVYVGSSQVKHDNLLREAKQILKNQKAEIRTNPTKKSRPVVIIVDEIDEMGVKTFSPSHNGSQPTNNFLRMTDTIETKELNIIIIGITNHPGELDAAMTRSGRLGFKIKITYPQQREEYEQIINFLSEKDPKLTKEKTTWNLAFPEGYWEKVKEITWEEKQKCSLETGISFIDIRSALRRSWLENVGDDSSAADSEKYRFWLAQIREGKVEETGLSNTRSHPKTFFFSPFCDGKDMREGEEA